MSIALVANVARTTGGTSAAIDTTGATLLVLVAGYLATGASSQNIPTVSDSKGNTWHVVNPRSSNNGAVAICLARNPVVGTGHTFTCSGGLPSFCAAAFSGVELVFPLFPDAPHNATSSGTSLQPGSVTPPLDDCLIIAGMGYRDTTTISVNGGFTITNQNPFNSGIAVGSALAYLIQSAAAASNPTFSWTNAVLATAQQIVIRPPAVGFSGGQFGRGFN